MMHLTMSALTTREGYTLYHDLWDGIKMIMQFLYEND